MRKNGPYGRRQHKRTRPETDERTQTSVKRRELVVREGRDGRRYVGVRCVRACLLAAYRRPTKGNRRHDGRARPRGIPHLVSAAARQCAQNAFLAVNDPDPRSQRFFHTRFVYCIFIAIIYVLPTVHVGFMGYDKPPCHPLPTIRL